MSFIFKPNPLQGAFLFKPSTGGSFIMSTPQRQFILNSNSTGAKGDKGDTGDTGVVDADFPLVYDSLAKSISITPNYYYLATNPNGFITSSALVGYATESWVTSQDYLVQSDLVGYATQSWVGSQGYLTSADLAGYATESWVDAQGYLTSVDLSGYATEAWVNAKNYLISSDLAPYLLSTTAASTYYPLTNPANYITAAALSGYATEAWVTGQNYITSAALTPYLLTSTAASTYYPLTNPAGYITNAALGGYATETWVQSQGYLTAPYNPFDQNLNTDQDATFTSVKAKIPIGLSTTEINSSGIIFPDATVQTTAYTGVTNPFDQSLNTTNEVAFRKTTLTDGGAGTSTIVIDPYWLGAGITHTVGGYIAGMSGINGFSHTDGTSTISIRVDTGITFPDGTTQATAATTPDLTPYAEKAVTNTFTASQVISVTDNSNAALRVTQTGTGEAFRVEDSTNPDSTPFVISNSGNVGIGISQNIHTLQVLGRSYFNNTSGAGGNAVAWVRQEFAGSPIVALQVTNQGVGASFRVDDEASDTTPFIVDAGGNVGVKTATPAYDLDVNGTANLTTLRFADGTTQTTAATGNAFDQDLNTFDAVQFSELNVTTAAYPTYGVFITPDGTITVNDDGSAFDGGIYLNGANVCIAFNGSDYQYKAYPFNGAVATAIEGGLLNANSPSSTNAFATLGDVESSVNAYAASVTPVLPTADEKAALSNANLPSASNPYLTLSGTPVASESNAGIVELASRSEVLAPTSTTLAVSPAQAATLATRMGLKRVTVNLQAGMFTQVTGTGATFNQITQYINFACPNSGITGFARGYAIMNTADPTHTSANGAWINFSKPEGFAIGIYLSNATSTAGIRVMGVWGETNSPTAGVAIGDPTNKRIAFSHTSGGNILLMVHDGTTLYTVDSGMTPPSIGTRKYYIEVTWDGTGYAEMYVKDANGLESTVSTNNAPIGAPQSVLHSTFLLQSSAVGTHTSNTNHSPTHPSFFFA